ncbi:MAG: hypothetical protein RLZZ522_1670 [Verrucomicrobiota bacterium]
MIRLTMSLHSQSRQIALLGNYAPRCCGIATFTHHLWMAVSGQSDGSRGMVLAVNDRPDGYDYPPEVRVLIEQKDLDSYLDAAHKLNQSRMDVLCVQHEFGIYGGPAGSHLVSLLREVRMPVVTTLHTLLHQPDPAQRLVMDALTRRSDRLVVMARKGMEILMDVYGVPESAIDLIPHGIPDMPFAVSQELKERLGIADKTVLLTFGLLGPSKGIEHAIRALPEIIAKHPEVVYLILGATHPHLVAREGEAYRTSLEHLAEDLGVTAEVLFFNRFVSHEELQEFIGAADIYLTPYLNESQITSGALAYVFGAGKAVVSTPYWHARELLADGRGRLVPFTDPPAIAAAVCGLLDDPAEMKKIGRHAYESSRSSIWPAVGRRYLESFDRARSKPRAVPGAGFAKFAQSSRLGKLPQVKLDHLIRMTDGTGMFQHATYNVPNFHEGYCTDDNARALILCHLLEDAAMPQPKQDLDLLATRYLAFLAAAFDRDSGHFRNFMSHSRHWLESRGSEDCHGRALWSVGGGTLRTHNPGHRRLCNELFERGVAASLTFTSPRAWAFTLLGLHDYLEHRPDHAESRHARDELIARLLDRHHHSATPDWPWFEVHLTYENARLCQALIRCGAASPHPAALDLGLATLRWLVAKQQSPAGYFRPIGSQGYLKASAPPARFDQQPVEAQAMVAACLEAFRATREDFWWREARRTFEWFLGRNDLGLPLADPASGGCRDGLHPERVNENQGAEATLAYQISLAELLAAEHLQPHFSTFPP